MLVVSILQSKYMAWLVGLKNKTQTLVAYKKDTSLANTNICLKWTDGKTILQAKRARKQVGVAIHISGREDSNQN
jgi:hypothetical protein